MLKRKVEGVEVLIWYVGVKGNSGRRIVVKNNIHGHVELWIKIELDKQREEQVFKGFWSRGSWHVGYQRKIK